MKRIIQRSTAAVVSAGILCGILGKMPAEKPLLSNGQIEAKAASTDFTADQAVQWARDRVNEQWNVDVDGLAGCQCVDLIKAYYVYLGYGQPIANAYQYMTIGLPDGWIRVSDPQPGDISVQDQYVGGAGDAGHVGIVTDVDSTTVRTAETNWPDDGQGGSYGMECHYVFREKSKNPFSCFIRPKWKPDRISGHVMSENESAGPTIPDGEYHIVSGLSLCYFLDIPGNDYNTKNGNRVQMWDWGENNLSREYDVFYAEYQTDGPGKNFYRLYQRTTNQCLDVSGADLYTGKNVNMWEKHGSLGQFWSIEPTSHGYRLRSKANSFCLDVVNGEIGNGHDVCTWVQNNATAQSWGFIPYQPKQIVKDGLYRIHSAVSDKYVLDASGNVGEYKAESNIQIWDSTGDDIFQITHDANGYYYISEISSGLVLDVNLSDSDFLKNVRNIALFPKANHRNKKWAFIQNDDTTYYIISLLSGYCLDLVQQKDNIYPNGTNITQYPYEGNLNQHWTLESVELKSIQVDQMPNKTAYFIGEEFNPTGIKVNAKYSGDYSIKIASGLTYVYDFSTAGEKEVTVKYELNGKELLDTFKITVNDLDFKGSGTESDPYLIESKADLIKMRDLINNEDYAVAFKSCWYKQTADIDLGGEKWQPIGKSWFDGKQTDRFFAGHYDGGNHWITGLNVSETTKFAGLFGSIGKGAVIENLAVQGAVSSEELSVGGIAGEMSGGNCTVQNCCFIGDVSGKSVANGGIVGFMWQDGTIRNCFHNGTVQTEDSSSGDAGGIVGKIVSNEVKNAVCTIENCYHVGKMETGHARYGTIVGYVTKEKTDIGQKIKLLNCYGLSGDGALYGAGDAPDTNTSKAVKESVLKVMAPTLGETYTKNPGTYLGGFPVFSWMIWVQGDLNGDGICNLADVVLLQKWLLTETDTLGNWKNGDINGDGKLNAVDLTMLKRALLIQ